MSYIEIRNIFKIFGPTPDTGLSLARGGVNKDEILARTGNTVGLHDVSLSIEQGETFVVMGLSGSGKSTLIRHLNRLIDPTAGQVTFGGEDILAMDIPTLNAFRRKRLGMVFQRFGLLPHRNVIDNVAYGLEIQGVDRSTRQEAAAKWISRVGLAGYESKFPDQLSGGMQQRVGLARALATDPEVLLMDEAFSALDPLIRSDMQDELMKLQEELHKTIVFITHDLDEALKIGDRIAILKDGKLVQVGRPEEIILHPADAYVEAFTRDVNRGRVIRARSIMRPIEDGLPAHDPNYIVDENERLEDIIAKSLSTESPIGVKDTTNGIVGLIERHRIVEIITPTSP
ncbi:quaternary amine ABC transporter ATP-binding protein [Thalassospira lucentensis]|uniref:quaternary amine ABC transporter ATP-binding protein n=1 Tax=Thalassospira lucentensis TaxID=168935 RepID=UPI00142D3ABD|nr:glycine betaine/L-proline ABC transporter ATP-binding protein [Thalassospira lucentensis]NIZ02481.1 glycine betaine/L-proline ABC transporter ATP-binding protein [Thalassospira lucentensis]